MYSILTSKSKGKQDQKNDEAIAEVTVVVNTILEQVDQKTQCEYKGKRRQPTFQWLILQIIYCVNLYISYTIGQENGLAREEAAETIKAVLNTQADANSSEYYKAVTYCRSVMN